MKPSKQQSVLSRACVDVHDIREEISPSMTALKSLGDDIIMRCQMDGAARAALHRIGLYVLNEEFTHQRARGAEWKDDSARAPPQKGAETAAREIP